jgi:hypothetical protein
MVHTTSRMFFSEPGPPAPPPRGTSQHLTTKWYTFPDLWQRLLGDHYDAQYKQNVFQRIFFPGPWAAKDMERLTTTSNKTSCVTPSAVTPHVAHTANDKGGQAHLSDGAGETTGNSRE